MDKQYCQERIWSSGDMEECGKPAYASWYSRKDIGKLIKYTKCEIHFKEHQQRLSKELKEIDKKERYMREELSNMLLRSERYE